MEKKSWSKIGELFAKKRAARSQAQGSDYDWIDRNKLKKVGESFKKKRSEQSNDKSY